MSRDAEAMLEKIDALAQRFQGMDRVWFYAQLARMLIERCAEWDAKGVDWGELEEIAKSASREAEQQSRTG